MALTGDSETVADDAAAAARTRKGTIRSGASYSCMAGVVSEAPFAGADETVECAPLASVRAAAQAPAAHVIHWPLHEAKLKLSFLGLLKFALVVGWIIFLLVSGIGLLITILARRD